MARIAVIGAGVGGLSVGVRLAAQGHQVEIFEQSATFGGKLGQIEYQGFHFDTGPSLVTLPAVYRDLFLKTGGPLSECLDLVPVDPAFHYQFADGTSFDMPNASRGQLLDELNRSLGPGTGAQWLALLDRADRMWDATREPFLCSPLDGLKTLIRLSRRFSDLRTIAPGRSLRHLGRQYLSDDRLRLVLERYATYTGSDPRRAPAALATIAYVEQTFGAWYLRGGLRTLGLALAQRFRELGGIIHLESPVHEVLIEDHRAIGVRTPAGPHLADIVIANADATNLYQHLVPKNKKTAATRRALARSTPSLSGFVILLALSGRTPGMRHHTVLFPQDYDAEFDAVFGVGKSKNAPIPVPDPTIYITNPDDPAIRPDDQHESWFILVNAPRHTPANRKTGIDWDAPGLAQDYADRILGILARRGYDLTHRILWRKVRTPADLERETASPGGSIYGSSSNGARAAFLRPSNRSVIDRLFLVGGSAHPGGGLPLVGLSAEIVAKQIGTAADYKPSRS